MSRARAAAAAFLLASLLPGCSSAERADGDRFRLNLFNDATLNASAAEAYEEVKKTEPVLSSGPRYEALQRVGRRIAEAANKPDYAWEFTLIDTPVVNAWCMPGGKVAVYTGMYPVAKDEASLAAVIGHEVAHATMRHANERASQAAVASVAGQILDSRLSNSRNRKVWMAVFGAGATVGVLLPYSRTQESEADIEGLKISARAGYDPAAAPGLWDRMAAEGSRMPEFLSTHPDPTRRAARLREAQGEVRPIFDASPRHPSTTLP